LHNSDLGKNDAITKNLGRNALVTSAVEVKTRNRAAEEGLTDDLKRLRVGPVLNRALAEAANHDRVVMIELNVLGFMEDISVISMC
jgi:hypothetical protein